MHDGSTTTPGAGERLGPLTAALQTATLPACVRDASGRYVAVNDAFADLVGLEPVRLVGKTDNALQPADVAHRVAELDALVFDARDHLDARELVLARDGRRTMRACRFPLFDGDEPWAICVVMAPGDDVETGRAEREKLQAAVGQPASGGAGLAEPVEDLSEELAAEREAREAADAEVLAAREALAAEREARVEAELSSRNAHEELERLREEAARLAGEREQAAARSDALDGELAGARERAEEAERRVAEAAEAAARRVEEAEAAASRVAEAERELAARCEALEGRLREVEDQRAGLHGQLDELRGELERRGHEEHHHGEQLANELSAIRDQRDRLAAEIEQLRAVGEDLRHQLSEAHGAREGLQAELAAERERHGITAGELEQERGRAEWLGGELAAAQEALRGAEEAVRAAESAAGEAHGRREELERELQAARDRIAQLDGELAGAHGRAEAAEGRLQDVEGERDHAFGRAESAETAHAGAQTQLAHARASHAEVEQRLAAAERERDEAREALQESGASSAVTIAALSEDLAAVEAERDAALAALAEEREARADAERRLAEVPALVAPAAPHVMTSPYAGGRGPSLPPLAVAAAQAKAFAHAAPQQVDGPPPGLTPEALDELDTALAKSSSARAAGRAALQALATATGWHGGALWTPREEGDFGCAETWSAAMSNLEAWETMAWRAHLEDGLVPAAAGSGEAHWADTEEMLACPRSRSAAWADLGTLATVPVRHPDGRVVAVLELVRRTRDAADDELLATLTGVAERLAERLGAIDDAAEAAQGVRI